MRASYTCCATKLSICSLRISVGSKYAFKSLGGIFALSDRFISSDGIAYVDASHTFSGSSYRLIWSDVSHLVAWGWVICTGIKRTISRNRSLALLLVSKTKHDHDAWVKASRHDFHGSGRDNMFVLWSCESFRQKS